MRLKKKQSLSFYSVAGVNSLTVERNRIILITVIGIKTIEAIRRTLNFFLLFLVGRCLLFVNCEF